MSDNPNISDKLDELIFWTKFSALPIFTTLVKNALRDDLDKLVYELSNGERSTRQIEHLIEEYGEKITHVTVANLWQKWHLMNLVIPAKRKGRYKKVISLESIGIEVPLLKNNKVTQLRDKKI